MTIVILAVMNWHTVWHSPSVTNTAHVLQLLLWEVIPVMNSPCHLISLTTSEARYHFLRSMDLFISSLDKCHVIVIFFWIRLFSILLLSMNNLNTLTQSVWFICLFETQFHYFLDWYWFPILLNHPAFTFPTAEIDVWPAFSMLGQILWDPNVEMFIWSSYVRFLLLSLFWGLVSKETFIKSSMIKLLSQFFLLKI